MTSGTVDRLALLQGNDRSRELCREVCACLAAQIYKASLGRGDPRKMAAAKVESVCTRAFSAPDGPSATEIGFYIAMDAPASELATRIVALLDCADDAHLIRAAVTSCQTAFGERLAILLDRVS